MRLFTKIHLLVFGAALPAAINATKDDMKNGNCAYNMYMCCWTENDGNGMEDNTDVCFVDGKEITRAEQVDTHCHGFAWKDDADHDTYIEPLHHYVRNFDHKGQRGYYGWIKGGRQCGCTEDMPIVTRADCTTIDGGGDFTACPGNDLIRQYTAQGLDKTKTKNPPNPNRGRNCRSAKTARDHTPVENQGHFNEGGGANSADRTSSTTESVDDYGVIVRGEGGYRYEFGNDDPEFTKAEDCEYNMYMCCWTENDGNGMEDNTDVCYVDGKYITKAEQVDTHCHGFAWRDGADHDTYIEPLHHYVRNFDHKGQRGYYGRIKGGHQCGCVEKMPIVSRADCTKLEDGEFVQCPQNDLIRQYNDIGLRKTKTRYPPNPNQYGNCRSWHHHTPDNLGHFKQGGGDHDMTSSTTSDYIDGRGFIREGETWPPTPAPTTVDQRTDKVYGCHYNMYMCCWTENDGNGMEDNTDVCYVDGNFIPKEEQVDTHCHGFAWKDGADEDTYVEPLHHYVRNYDHKGQRGYYGRIKGGRQCGCTEDMPIVERADCTTIDRKGNFVACPRNDLYRGYRQQGLHTTKTEYPPNPNRKGDCEGADEAREYTADENKGHFKQGGGEGDHDMTSSSTSRYIPGKGFLREGETFAPTPAPTTVDQRTDKVYGCHYNMYMCCWTENDGNGMEDNTDVCYVDGNFIPKEEQVDTHCHGFAWKDGADEDTYVEPLHHYVRNYDHKGQRGYYGRIKGGRQCGCTEDMPIVERADCTTIDRKGNFVACPRNDLYRGYRQQGLHTTKTEYPPNPNRKGDCEGADEAREYTADENKGHFKQGGGEGDHDMTSSSTSVYIPGKGFLREGETFAPTPAPTTVHQRTDKVYGCHYNMYMCCWTENDGNGMEPNTEVCYVNGRKIPKKEQVDTHCHGFAWENDADQDTYIEPLHHFVRNYDHKGQRGYYGRIKGGRQCGCVEDMPIVTRADCTKIDDKTGEFIACPKNDLMREYVSCGRPRGFWTPNPSAWGTCQGAKTAADKFTAEENKGHHVEGGGDTEHTDSSTSYLGDNGTWVRGGVRGEKVNEYPGDRFLRG